MFFFFFFNDTATTEIYTLSLHDALPICLSSGFQVAGGAMKPRAILLGAVAIALGCGGCGKREESLSLLVWEGYADESAVHDFEQSHHCKVSASYMGSSDELVAKLRGGSASNYDVISPSSDVAASIARAGLAAPLNLSKIPSYSQLSNKLRDLPLVKPGGQVYEIGRAHV